MNDMEYIEANNLTVDDEFGDGYVYLINRWDVVMGVGETLHLAVLDAIAQERYGHTLH